MTDAELSGRHVVITGAGSGIGEATAYELAAAGARLTLAGRRLEPLERTAQKCRDLGVEAQVCATDVASPADVAELVRHSEEFAPVWACVNSAGHNRPGPTIGYSIDDFDGIMRTAVRGAFLVCQAFGEKFVERGAGRIVNVTSQMGSVGYPGRAVYCASKAAVDGLTRALAVEWATHGVTVNSVAPTFVETPMTARMFDDPTFSEDVLRRIPRGTLGTLEEVTVAIAFLVSPRSSLVNGHILAVDGGWTAW